MNQPHRSFYGKMTWYLNGINPFPPGHKNNPAKNNETFHVLDKNNNQSAHDPELGKDNEEEAKNEGDLNVESIAQ